MNTAPYFHLVLRPDLGVVSTIRRFTNELYQRVLDQGLAARLALATHEVLENAISYGGGREAELRIDIEGDELHLRTWNHAAPDRIEAIKDGIDQLMAASDPDAYYQEQINVSYQRTDGGSGLEGYIEKLHQEACRLKMQKVVVDLRNLEFMNSSSFKVFITWLGHVKELPADAQYRIHVLSNPNTHQWQRRSLAALSCFAVDLVTIET